MVDLTKEGGCDMFSDRLDFLMNLTDTSNSALGRTLNFDPSYISRIRSGKRGLPKHLPFLEPAAAYFARKLDDPIRRSSLESIVCPGRAWPDEVAESEQLLISWLSDDSRSAANRVARLLAILGERMPIPSAAVTVPLSDAGVKSATCFYGNEGKRESALLFLGILCAEESPHDLLFFSDEDSEWIFEDSAFAGHCTELLLRLIRRGTHIRIIHPISQELDVMLLALRTWLPLYMTGAIEAYYFPEPPGGFFRRTLFVAEGHSAVTATSASGSGNRLTLFLREPEAVAALTQEYMAMLSSCKPLMQTFREDSGDDLWPVLSRFNRERSPWIIAQRLPVGFTMPERIAASIARRGGGKLAEFHRSASRQFAEILDSGLPISELLWLPPVRDVRDGKVHIPLCDYLGMPNLRYTPCELKDHLLAVKALLKERSNYRVIVTDSIPRGTLIYAKQDYGCIVARLVRPVTVFFTSEPHTSALLWAYLDRFAALGQSRESVIQMLDDYIIELGKPED